MKKILNTNILLALAVFFGALSFFFPNPIVYSVADVISDLFIRLLNLVSLPIIFLSIVSTASSMESIHELKSMGGRVVKYTLMTTLLAASVALGLFLIINPTQGSIPTAEMVIDPNSHSYFHYLLNAVPSNFLQPFIEHNVISVLILSMLLSLAVLTLPDENRHTLHQFFKSLYAAVMKVTIWIIKLMPLAIWAFITLFIRDLNEGLEFKNIALYLAVVVGANLFQGVVVLPLLLKSKGISPIKAFRGALPALSVAFFSKSSNAALPMAMRCVEERLNVSKKVAGFTLPLCTTINMNGCAAFILTTVLFVSMSHGMVYTPVELLLWIFLATIAAVGNAGVPMGCYFLSSAFLAAMGVPLNILGIILPFYSLIDMLETAINVWSDTCVTLLVQKETDQEVGAVFT